MNKNILLMLMTIITSCIAYELSARVKLTHIINNTDRRFILAGTSATINEIMDEIEQTNNYSLFTDWFAQRTQEDNIADPIIYTTFANGKKHVISFRDRSSNRLTYIEPHSDNKFTQDTATALANKINPDNPYNVPLSSAIGFQTLILFDTDVLNGSNSVILIGRRFTLLDKKSYLYTTDNYFVAKTFITYSEPWLKTRSISKDGSIILKDTLIKTVTTADTLNGDGYLEVTIEAPTIQQVQQPASAQSIIIHDANWVDAPKEPAKPVVPVQSYGLVCTNDGKGHQECCIEPGHSNCFWACAYNGSPSCPAGMRCIPNANRCA